jgi:osmotically-inducible protein OsmY
MSGSDKERQQIEADDIAVITDGGTATRRGSVHSRRDRDPVERTAWSAPGVTQAEDRLTANY